MYEVTYRRSDGHRMVVYRGRRRWLARFCWWYKLHRFPIVMYYNGKKWRRLAWS